MNIFKVITPFLLIGVSINASAQLACSGNTALCSLVKSNKYLVLSDPSYIKASCLKNSAAIIGTGNGTGSAGWHSGGRSSDNSSFGTMHLKIIYPGGKTTHVFVSSKNDRYTLYENTEKLCSVKQ